MMNSKFFLYRRKIIVNFAAFLGNYLDVSIEGKHLVLKHMVIIYLNLNKNYYFIILGRFFEPQLY